MVRILVVDDNPSARHYLRSILEQQSAWHVCWEAKTGAEALQKADELKPDVILLDFQLPDLNGLDIAHKMRLLWPSIPILMVTIHASNQLAKAAQAVGVGGICSKSDVGSIVGAVQSLLDNQLTFP